MSFVYDLAFFFFALFYLPVFMVKIRQSEKPRELMRQRFGVLPAELVSFLKGGKTVWLHAVSVGETIAVQPFVGKFLERYRDYNLLITTVTPTGQKIARKMEGPRVRTAYFPFDFSFAVSRFFDAVRPACLLLAETEIWPNLIRAASSRGIPVIILNGRLSERSASRYGRFRILFEPLFRKLGLVLAQDEKDADRFSRLGVRADRVTVTGNIKYDNFDMNLDQGRVSREMRGRFGLPEDQPVWVAGSTHPGEEEILFSAYVRLKGMLPALKLILVPRHIERAPELTALAGRYGLKTVLSSSFKAGFDYQVLIVDQLGILKNFYAAADVVFTGGSLIPKGGQNPIEPAAFHRAILHGPHYFNFEQAYRLLDREGGALLIHNEDELYSAVKRILGSPVERSGMGDKAYQSVCSMRGATARSLEILDSFFPQEAIVAKG